MYLLIVVATALLWPNCEAICPDCLPENMVDTNDNLDDIVLNISSNIPDGGQIAELFNNAVDEIMLGGSGNMTIVVELPGDDAFCLHQVQINTLLCNFLYINLYDSTGQEICPSFSATYPTEFIVQTNTHDVVCCCGVARVEYTCMSETEEFALSEADIFGCYIPEWCSWSEWSCDVTCGDGTQTRDRICECPNPDPNRWICDGDAEETEVCNPTCCPEPAYWSAWGPWGACDVSCDGGTQSRTRTCETPNCWDNVDCSGPNTEEQSCNEDCCEEKIQYINVAQFLTAQLIGESIRNATAMFLGSGDMIIMNTALDTIVVLFNQVWQVNKLEVSTFLAETITVKYLGPDTSETKPVPAALQNSFSQTTFDSVVDGVTGLEITLTSATLEAGIKDVAIFVCPPETPDNCICRVRGDPVVQDCDGQLLTLRGEGYFEIASSDGNEACPAFRSFVYDSVVEDDGLVIPIDLYIYVMGKTIQIKRDMTVWVDGVQVALPWNGMGISITMSDGYVKVVLSETCDVEFAFLVEGDLSKIYVQIPGSLFNNVDGLCGNFNGDPDDDLALEDGTPSDDRNEISDSYKLDVLPPNVP